MPRNIIKILIKNTIFFKKLYKKYKKLYKKYYIYIKTLGRERMKNAETLGYIYAILIKLSQKDLTVEEAMTLIRELLSL